MQRLDNGVIVLTADDEEPDCLRCVNVVCSEKFCLMCCGSANGWNGYERHISEKEYWKGCENE